jgi:hypothetical protein
MARTMLGVASDERHGDNDPGIVMNDNNILKGV